MTAARERILIATRNAGKLAEFQRLLGDGFQVEGLDNFDLALPAEGLTSYRTNAEQKAQFVAEKTGRLTLGDDSGLEVIALDGRPGIISARFAGEPLSEARNIDKLLSELAGSPTGNRAARFICWLALADQSGLIASVEGICEGTIGFVPRGENGFGYDPVFVFGDGRTMAEHTDSEKDAISHRGAAVRAMLPVIESVATGRIHRV